MADEETPEPTGSGESPNQVTDSENPADPGEPTYAPALTDSEIAPGFSAAVPPTAVPPISVPPRNNGIKKWMWVAGAALLVIVVGLGVATAWLLIDRSSTADAQAKQDAKIQAERDAVAPQFEVENYPVRVESELEFGIFSIGKSEERETTSLYGTVQNTNKEKAATAYFDVTALDENGGIVQRTSTNMYLLPDQVSLLSGYFDVDISKAETIRIEQTSLEFDKPIVKGSVKLNSASLFNDGFFEADLTSTLNKKTEYSNLYFIGTVDKKIYTICNDFSDIPAKTDFDALCQPEMMQVDGETIKAVPKETNFEVLFALDIPY